MEVGEFRDGNVTRLVMKRNIIDKWQRDKREKNLEI